MVCSELMVYCVFPEKCHGVFRAYGLVCLYREVTWCVQVLGFSVSFQRSDMVCSGLRV